MITLATLPHASKQEIYNQVKHHLLTQKKQANTGLGCKYRTKSGLKCAAGCLIGDDEYKPEMENKLWVSLANMGTVPDHEMHFISVLQTIHDEFEVESWEEKLKEFAIKQDLEP